MLKKNLFFTLILSISQFIFPLITFPYSSRILGPKAIGSVNFIDSITQYFILIAALGVPTYGIREIVKTRNNSSNLNKVFSEILSLHLLSTVFFASVYLTISLIVPSLFVNLDLVFLGIFLMLFSALSVEWFYGGIEKFSYITTRTLIIRTLSVVALFVFLKKGASPFVYYFLTTATVALTSFANLFNLRRYISIRVSALNFRKHLKPLLIISGSTLAVSVYVLLDNIILGFIKGDVAVGIYSTATKIGKIPFALLVAINAVIIPKVSAAYSEGNREEIKTLINKSFAFLCIIGIPLSGGICTSASFLVTGLVGNMFMDAIPVLQILSPITFIVGLTFIFAAQLLTPIGQEKPLFKIAFIGMIFSLVFNLILIPRFSYMGAAITNIATEILVVFLCYLITKKHIVISLDRNIFLQCLIGTLLFVPIAFIIRTLNFGFFNAEVIIIVTCTTVYLFYVWFFVNNIYISNIKRSILDKLRFGV